MPHATHRFNARLGPDNLSLWTMHEEVSGCGSSRWPLWSLPPKRRSTKQFSWSTSSDSPLPFQCSSRIRSARRCTPTTASRASFTGRISTRLISRVMRWTNSVSGCQTISRAKVGPDCAGGSGPDPAPGRSVQPFYPMSRSYSVAAVKVNLRNPSPMLDLRGRGCNSSPRRHWMLPSGLPETHQLFVVTGQSRFDKGVAALAKAALAPYDARPDVTYLTDLPIGQLQERLRHLPSHSIVVFLTFFKDVQGREFVSTSGCPSHGGGGVECSGIWRV